VTEEGGMGSAGIHSPCSCTPPLGRRYLIDEAGKVTKLRRGNRRVRREDGKMGQVTRRGLFKSKQKENFGVTIVVRFLVRSSQEAQRRFLTRPRSSYCDASCAVQSRCYSGLVHVLLAPADASDEAEDL
jgi:hypothetical protein